MVPPSPSASTMLLADSLTSGRIESSTRSRAMISSVVSHRLHSSSQVNRLQRSNIECTTFGILTLRVVHALAGHENSIGCSGVSLCDNCGISVTIDQIIFMFVLWVHMRGVSRSESAGLKREEPSGRRTWNPGLKQLRGWMGPTELVRPVKCEDTWV